MYRVELASAIAEILVARCYIKASGDLIFFFISRELEPKSGDFLRVAHLSSHCMEYCHSVSADGCRFEFGSALFDSNQPTLRRFESIQYLTQFDRMVASLDLFFFRYLSLERAFFWTF